MISNVNTVTLVPSSYSRHVSLLAKHTGLFRGEDSFCAVVDCPEAIAIDVFGGFGIKVEGKGGGRFTPYGGCSIEKVHL